MAETKQDVRGRTLGYGTLLRPAQGPKGTVVSPGTPAPRPAAPLAPPVEDFSSAATIVDAKHDAAFGATIDTRADTRDEALHATMAASEAETLSPAISAHVVSGLAMSLQGDASASPVSTGTSSGRVTVLPRIETVGTETRVVRETRVRYVHEKKLGEGGVGEVLGAIDQDIGRRVAVKRLHPGQRSDASLLRFADEVRTIGRLEHPNIIPIHDVGVDEQGDHYFVMKYIDGETLEAIIEKLAAGDAAYHDKYTVERRVEIFTALLEAVGFAHARGIIHRDIKPANVMVGPYGEVVLMDWGIAKMKSRLDEPTAKADGPASRMPVLSSESNAKTTGAGGIVGTPAYMSPEQAKGLSVDERSDTYSLTMLFYEFLGLVHPLDGKKTLKDVLDAVVNEPVPNILMAQSKNTPTVPTELMHFVRHGLAKDPAKRYQSVDAMLGRLRARADGDIPIECPTTFVKQSTNKWVHFVDNHPFVAVTVAMFGAFGVIGGISLALMTALGVLHH